MYTIVMHDDKSMHVTNAVPLYEKETNIDVFRFLLPTQYAEGAELYNLADFVVACKVKTPSGRLFVYKLDCEDVTYKDRLDYRLVIGADITQFAGTVEMYLTMLRVLENEDGSSTETVFHSGTVYIEILRKEEFVFIPDKSLQAIDQLLLQTQDKINQLDKIAEKIETTKADDIEVIDGQIFLVTTDEETGEKIPIGDPVTNVKATWSEM